MKIIDAHSHLWLCQDTQIDGKPIRTTTNGRSIFFGEEKQMLPPFMIDGKNSAEVFLSNMDYAQVSAAVVTQEFIDGIQNEYLMDVQKRYPDRFFVCGMCDFRCDGFLDDAKALIDKGFRGMKIPAHRMYLNGERKPINTSELMSMYKYMEQKGVILSLDLAPGTTNVEEVNQIVQECPDLKVTLGHFASVTMPDWESQLRLALHKNVMIESGGITWLFNDEFYPFAGAVKSIRHAIDAVGIEKLMWGSDYPRTITAITYRMSYDFIIKSHELTDHELELFMAGNAQKFYGFKHLIDLPYIKNMSE